MLTCRVCGGGGLRPILDLGRTPLANALLRADQLNEPEPTYPLALVFCPTCSLIQITETVPPEQLFSDYPYFSSFSDTMLAHARQLATRFIDERRLGPAALVVEIASNDGYLLQYYHQQGIPVLGIEPAANVARVAEAERSVRTLCAFFSRPLASEVVAQFGRASVVHAHNVLAHVPDLTGFVGGIADLLREDGIACLEVPYVRDLIEQTEFDTIYHEHLCYFSLTALDRLFSRQGLAIVDVERVSIHGGSLRIFAAHPASQPVNNRVRDLLAEELAVGLVGEAYYEAFAERVQRLRTELVALLREAKAAGKRIAGYGASAKGSTLLNFFGIGREVIDYVVDRSTVKQGRFTPGTHLPILHPEQLLIDRPDLVLLLTWNFADEIIEQQRAYLEQGGAFLIPVPTPRLVQASYAHS